MNRPQRQAAAAAAAHASKVPRIKCHSLNPKPQILYPNPYTLHP